VREHYNLIIYPRCRNGAPDDVPPPGTFLEVVSTVESRNLHWGSCVVVELRPVSAGAPAQNDGSTNAIE